MPYRAQGARLIAAAKPAALDQQITQVASRISAAIGAHFFHSMTEHLAKVLEADCAFIGEFVGGANERVRTLAAWVDGKPDSFVFELAGTAAAQVALGESCVCRSRAQSRFPSDPLLAQWAAHACIGVPLLDGRGIALGLIMMVYRRAVKLNIAQEVLDVFAPRAAAELKRRQEEEQLRQSEQRYRAFVTRNDDALWRIELSPPVSTALPEAEQLDAIYRDGYIAECNEALVRQLGAGAEKELLGARLNDVAALSNPSVRDATLQAIRSGYRFNTLETNPVGPDGKRRYILRSQWGIVDDGMLQRIWGSARDITDLKRSEQALDAAELRFAGLMQSLSLIVLMLYPNGEIIFCNLHFARLTGWHLTDVAGKDWLELMIPPGEHARVRAAIAATTSEPPRPVHFESPLVGRTGERRWIAWDGITMKDSAGAAAATALVGCDITEFKALEAQYHQAQKLEHIGRMAGGIAHDFNNLLTVVMGHTGVLLEKIAPNDPMRDILRQILKAAEQGGGLTQRLFAFSRHRILRPEVLNPATLIAGDERMIRQLVGPAIQVVTQLEGTPAFVKVDAGHLHQVILNLVVNARDAMPNGGVVSIATDTSNPDYVQLTVSDTGIGMSEEVRDHIFEPFFTTKGPGKGTGLGLPTVYGIVQQSGGHMVVDTRAGVGTSFRIFLPRVYPPTAPSDPHHHPAEMPRGTETVLVVDDEPDVRALAASILRDLGYGVVEARDSTHAIEFARGGAGPLQLLLAGAALTGSAGAELADAIRKCRRQIRVLFMADYTGPESTMQILSERGFAWLQKPFTPEALARAVRDLLDQP